MDDSIFEVIETFSWKITVKTCTSLDVMTHRENCVIQKVNGDLSVFSIFNWLHKIIP